MNITLHLQREANGWVVLLDEEQMAGPIARLEDAIEELRACWKVAQALPPTIGVHGSRTFNRIPVSITTQGWRHTAHVGKAKVAYLDDESLMWKLITREILRDNHELLFPTINTNQEAPGRGI